MKNKAPRGKGYNFSKGEQPWFIARKAHNKRRKQLAKAAKKRNRS